jgi:putative transcriptional regulator
MSRYHETTPAARASLTLAKSREITAAKLLAAVRSHPDNPPLANKGSQRPKRVPRVQTLRRALLPTQQEFAARSHIPFGRAPDQRARAYLTVIGKDPVHVRTTLLRDAAQLATDSLWMEAAPQLHVSQANIESALFRGA